MPTEAAWWQRGVIYQIYPRSFQDSNGDGIGDLAGITARLDYLVALGVDAIWLSPVNPSPMADFGYDVSDYTGIDPVFGTMADFEALLAAAHTRGLKLIMDFVPNHTSEQHAWFLESRSSRDNPKRDWYIWRDGKDSGPPNNWMSEFGGSAWTFDEATGQYYYHAYLPQQPDLNWRNPAVRAAMYGALRFWLNKGVDGFRLDTIHHLFEDEHLRDNPLNPDFHDGLPPRERFARTHQTDQPEVIDVLAELREVCDAYENRVLIGEAYLPLEQLMRYYGDDRSAVHLPFNFHLIGAPWEAAYLAELIWKYERLLPRNGWPNWVLGNHDRSRVASRFGAKAAPLAAMLLLTLRGTPTLYYGDELGMTDVAIAPASVQDPWEKRVPGFGLGRDPVRTPMAWTPAAHGEFTTGTPWLPLHDDIAALNVETLAAKPQSLLALYRELIALRRREPALSLGNYGTVECRDDVLIYERIHADRRLLVALNFGSAVLYTPLPCGGDLLLSTVHGWKGKTTGDLLRLQPHEGVIVDISNGV